MLLSTQRHCTEDSVYRAHVIVDGNWTSEEVLIVGGNDSGKSLHCAEFETRNLGYTVDQDVLDGYAKSLVASIAAKHKRER